MTYHSRVEANGTMELLFVPHRTRDTTRRAFRFFVRITILSKSEIEPVVSIRSVREISVCFENKCELGLYRHTKIKRICIETIHILFVFVPEARLELARIIHPRDFKSLVSTNSTTRAFDLYTFEVTPGFEPG